MSPAAKSKSKSSARASKEQQKASNKPSGSSTGNGVPASAYNPISGTFHTLDTSSTASSPSGPENGRFRNIDDTNDHSSSPHGTVSEFDSVSNNGSCSGESEDLKEKHASSAPRQEPIPGSDIDRREKIRLKNEKKHQRQREKRAQELHEKCCGYLMSRKLEALSQQLVAMGFSAERATLALMLNEGRAEESVNWLFEVSEEEVNSKDPAKLESSGNLRIDITEEIARISAMEVKYKCTKQEVERAVVAFEGNLDRAEDTIKQQKQDKPSTPPKREDAVDTKTAVKPQEKPTTATPMTIQQRRNERDFNYTKSVAPVQPTMYSEPGSRNLQTTITNQTKPVTDKRWSTNGISPSISLNTAAAPVQVSPSTKPEVRHTINGSESKNVLQGSIREPVIMMQRPQSLNSKQIPVIPSVPASSPSVTAGWYVKNVPAVESIRSNGKILQTKGNGGIGLENQSSEQFYRQSPYKEIPYMYGMVDTSSNGLGGPWNASGASSSFLVSLSEPRNNSMNNNIWGMRGMPSPNGVSSSPSLTVPSSLGLFSGWGSAGSLGSSSHVDWNTSGGMMQEFDYTSVDWTLDPTVSSPSSKSSRGLWPGLSSILRNSSSGMRMGGVNNNGSYMLGVPESGVAVPEMSPAGADLREWTSPFAEKDIFSVPRQFVTSPSP